MNNIYAIITFAVALLCSCSKEEIKGVPEDPLLIRISGGIEVGRSTKAAITNGALPSPRDIFVASYNRTASRNFFPGTRFSYKSGTWSSDKSWPLSGTLDFLAYSPGASAVTSVIWGTPDVTSSVKMTMPDNSATQEDILAGCATGKVSNSSVDIDFKHAEAYLTFAAKAAESYNSSTNRGVTINSITLKSAYHSGTVQASRSDSAMSFTWSGLGAQKTLTLPGLSATDLTTAAATLGAGILLPPQTEVGFTINYTLHNGKDVSGANVNTTLVYDWTPTSPVSWEPGEKYTYTINITLVGITIIPSISAWTSGTNKEIKL